MDWSASPSASAASASPSVAASASPTASTAVASAPYTGSLFPGHRVVAFYGAAGAPSLGVLGRHSPEGTWPRLAKQAAAYRSAGTPVIPAYELITYVATGSPGAHHDYATRVSDATIASYVKAADAHHALVILDIQPGRGSFLDDAKSLATWLRHPDVELALDPEWKLYGHQKPARQIGHTTATAVNEVSAWLNQLTAAAHLPQKLLLLHQFTLDGIRDKGALATRSHVATVVNMDGFGGRAAKLSKYRYLARDPTFPLGMKLFFHQDVHRFTAKETLALHPAPAVVDYE
jgi:hypothetical protein